MTQLCFYVAERVAVELFAHVSESAAAAAAAAAATGPRPISQQSVVVSYL